MTEEYHRSMVFSIHRFIMRLRRFFYSCFKEKGPRIVAKVLCDGPFASDYFTGVGFW